MLPRNLSGTVLLRQRNRLDLQRLDDQLTKTGFHRPDVIITLGRRHHPRRPRRLDGDDVRLERHDVVSSPTLSNSHTRGRRFPIGNNKVHVLAPILLNRVPGSRETSEHVA